MEQTATFVRKAMALGASGSGKLSAKQTQEKSLP